MGHTRAVDRLRQRQQNQRNGQAGGPNYPYPEDECPEVERGDAWESPTANQVEAEPAEVVFGEPIPWPAALAAAGRYVSAMVQKNLRRRRKSLQAAAYDS